jgi:serine/threonine protein kinase
MNAVPAVGARVGAYELLSPLGSGSFAVVWLARHTIIGCPAAIKIIQRSSLDTTDSVTRFTREISILRQMRHPFIAELFEELEDEYCYFIVMEYVEGGSMLNAVNTHGPLEEERACRYFCELISALDYLHNTKFIAHRDVKAENVMIDRNDTIRLIDFGLSRAFTKGSPNLSTTCGSPAYAAPEVIRGMPYTKACDIWSAGILLYAMVAGRLPFDASRQQVLLQKVLTDDIVFPPTMSRSLTDLLRRVLVRDPDGRITIDHLKEHPWFAQCEYAVLASPNTSFFFGDQSPTFVDSEVIAAMGALGFDCRDLPRQIESELYTDLTAIYRQIQRERLRSRMEALMRSVREFHRRTIVRRITTPSPETIVRKVSPTLKRIIPKMNRPVKSATTPTPVVRSSGPFRLPASRTKPRAVRPPSADI